VAAKAQAAEHAAEVSTREEASDAPFLSLEYFETGDPLDAGSPGAAAADAAAAVERAVYLAWERSVAADAGSDDDSDEERRLWHGSDEDNSSALGGNTDVSSLAVAASEGVRRFPGRSTSPRAESPVLMRRPPPSQNDLANRGGVDGGVSRSAGCYAADRARPQSQLSGEHDAYAPTAIGHLAGTATSSAAHVAAAAAAARARAAASALAAGEKGSGAGGSDCAGVGAGGVSCSPTGGSPAAAASAASAYQRIATAAAATPSARASTVTAGSRSTITGDSTGDSNSRRARGGGGGWDVNSGRASSSFGIAQDVSPKGPLSPGQKALHRDQAHTSAGGAKGTVGRWTPSPRLLLLAPHSDAAAAAEEAAQQQQKQAREDKILSELRAEAERLQVCRI
jgi:hypothetical protein